VAVAAGALLATTRLGVLGARPVAATTPVVVTPEPVALLVPEPPRPSLADTLSESSDKASAFKALYARWRVDYRGKSGELACDQARQAGLRCLFRAGTWNVVRRLDLPAIVALDAPDGDKRYAVVTTLGEETATLEIGGRSLTVPLRELERAWDGAFIALWRAPSAVMPPLAPGMRGTGIVWLRQRLRDADGGAGGSSDLYDDELKRRVVAFQRAQQLIPDGIVGEETLVRLSMLAPDSSVPSLSAGAR
jgi:general secretion pathway protein A